MTESLVIEERVRAVLDETGVPYEVIDIDPEFADTAAFCQKYGYPMDKSDNTIVVASKREPIQHAACVVTASTRLDVNKTVRKLMGVRKLSFATPDQTMAVTGNDDRRRHAIRTPGRAAPVRRREADGA